MSIGSPTILSVCAECFEILNTLKEEATLYSSIQILCDLGNAGNGRSDGFFLVIASQKVLKPLIDSMAVPDRFFISSNFTKQCSTDDFHIQIMQMTIARVQGDDMGMILFKSALSSILTVSFPLHKALCKYPLVSRIVTGYPSFLDATNNYCIKSSQVRTPITSKVKLLLSLQCNPLSFFVLILFDCSVGERFGCDLLLEITFLAVLKRKLPTFWLLS